MYCIGIRLLRHLHFRESYLNPGSDVQDGMQLRKIVKFVVEFNKKSQILLHMQLKWKIVKFVKFVTAFDPGHKGDFFLQMGKELKTSKPVSEI